MCSLPTFVRANWHNGPWLPALVVTVGFQQKTTLVESAVCMEFWVLIIEINRFLTAVLNKHFLCTKEASKAGGPTRNSTGSSKKQWQLPTGYSHLSEPQTHISRCLCALRLVDWDTSHHQAMKSASNKDNVVFIPQCYTEHYKGVHLNGLMLDSTFICDSIDYQISDLRTV